MKEPDEQALPQVGDYFRILWVRKWSIVAVSALVIATWLGWLARRPPVYSATAEVLVKPVGIPDPKMQFGMETERRIAASLGVASTAAERLQVEDPKTLLAGLVVAPVSAETPVLSITYSAADPASASRGAQALAEAYLDYRRQQVVDDLVASSRAVEQQLRVLKQRLAAVNERVAASGSEAMRQLLIGQGNALSGQVAVLEQQQLGTIAPDSLKVGEILKPAATSSLPAGRLKEGAIVLFAALTIGLGQALVREFVEGRVRESDEVQRLLGAPVLGSLPGPGAVRPRNPWRRRLVDEVTSAGADSYEAFRRIRVALTLALERSGASTIVVAGAVKDDDVVASVGTNLGAALARQGRRVAVIATDPDDTGSTRLLAAGDRGSGLAESLADGNGLGDALRPTTTEGLWLLPAGSRTPTLSDLLGSKEMEKLLHEMRATADVVLIQTRSVLVSADAVTLAPLVDGILLVVEIRKTRRQDLREIQQQFTRVGATVIGAIVHEG